VQRWKLLRTERSSQGHVRTNQEVFKFDIRMSLQKSFITLRNFIMINFDDNFFNLPGQLLCKRDIYATKISLAVVPAEREKS
jgi:hypothetical protein